MKGLCLLGLALVVAAPAARAAGVGELGVGQTTTNARPAPLGIDGDDISFGWTLDARMRGARQRAYQVRVGVQPGRWDTWDSGRHQLAGRALRRPRPLHDVFALSDRLCVMKNGRTVGTYRTADVDEDVVLGMIIAGRVPPGASPCTRMDCEEGAA
jgi:hypothetical protein